MVSGFANAPISKGLIIFTSISSLLCALFQLKPYTHLQIVPHLTVHHQFWRLAAHHIAFANSSDLFIGILLFYSVSTKVERTFGTPKFAAFLATTTFLYTIFFSVTLWLLALLFNNPSWLPAPSGPIGPLCAILYQHSRIIPDRWLIRIGRIYLGDRAIQVWSLALLLLMTNSLPCLLAVTASFFYRSDFLLSSKVKQSRIPKYLYTLLASILTPLIGSTQLPSRSWRAEPPLRRTLEQRQNRQEEVNAVFRALRQQRERAAGQVFDFAIRRRRRATTTTRPSDPSPLLPFSNQPDPQRQNESFLTQPPDRSVNQQIDLSSPSEINIRALGSIFPHFDRQQIVNALEQSNGSQTAAIERLLVDTIQLGRQSGLQVDQQ